MLSKHIAFSYSLEMVLVLVVATLHIYFSDEWIQVYAIKGDDI